MSTASSAAQTEARLSSRAAALVATLTARYRRRVDELLHQRRLRQARFDAGELPGFLPETRAIREDPAWRVAPPPEDLRDRRVEITGPVDRKTIINGLNSGARVFMADFEDSLSPTWDNILDGQQNLSDAIRGTIAYVHPETGREYRLQPTMATLMVRPRGWHLIERHWLVDNAPVPAAIFDAAVFLANNAHELVLRGTAPYFYLPKLESHREARLWNDLFIDAEDALGLKPGTIRATVLIETLPAAFEMEEILYELRDRSIGLNGGRWDYIFSSIKTRRLDTAYLLPDRAAVTMEQPCMRAYTRLLVATCHRRGAQAIGGMAAQIPQRDPAANELAFARVRADKQREADAGHDGTWVAHPGLVPLAYEIFGPAAPHARPFDRVDEETPVTEADLLAVPQGQVTEQGVRHNIRVTLQYLAAWLDGRGCVPLDGLMEDAATAEISRAQLWQWLRHGATLADGRLITARFLRICIAEEAAALRPLRRNNMADAVALVEQSTLAEALPEFLTVPAYARLRDRRSAPMA